MLETVTGTLRRRFGGEHGTDQTEYGECVDAAQDDDCPAPPSLPSPTVAPGPPPPDGARDAPPDPPHAGTAARAGYNHMEF